MVIKALFASGNFTKILPASKQELQCWPRDSVASCLPTQHPCVRLRMDRAEERGEGWPSRCSTSPGILPLVYSRALCLLLLHDSDSTASSLTLCQKLPESERATVSQSARASAKACTPPPPWSPPGSTPKTHTLQGESTVPGPPGVPPTLGQDTQPLLWDCLVLL